MEQGLPFRHAVSTIRHAVEEVFHWVLDRGYTNVLVKLVNECDNREYDQPLLRWDHVPELIQFAKSITKDGRHLLVAASFNGGSIPTGILAAAPEIADYVAAVKQRGRKVLGLALRQLLRLVREYPREPLLAAVREAARYGLYDLDRLERMILRRVAREYFLLDDGKPSDD